MDINIDGIDIEALHGAPIVWKNSHGSAFDHTFAVVAFIDADVGFTIKTRDGKRNLSCYHGKLSKEETNMNENEFKCAVKMISQGYYQVVEIRQYDVYTRTCMGSMSCASGV